MYRNNNWLPFKFFLAYLTYYNLILKANLKNIFTSEALCIHDKQNTNWSATALAKHFFFL